MRTQLRTRLRPMDGDDIAQVMDVERESFPSMWPQTAYRRELTNKIARYIVLTEMRDEPPDVRPSTGVWSMFRRFVGSSTTEAPHNEHLLGFIGIWLMVGEAHVVTVAVRDQYRRMGIGERLLIAAIEAAMEADQEVATLEVRASNDAAQLLYAKYGFARLGLRKRYYTDNNEDAVIMTTADLSSSGFRSLFDALRNEHRQRYPDLWS